MTELYFYDMNNYRMRALIELFFIYKVSNKLRVACILAGFFFLSPQVFSQQVGVVDGEIYYTVNADLKNGDALQLVDWGDASIYCCAKIIGRKSGKDSPSIFDSLQDRSIIEYSISKPEKVPEYLNGFGVIGNAKLNKKRGGVNAMLDHGLEIHLSGCMSMEGIHYVGRRVDNGKILVHFYKNMDVDFDPTCKNLS